ncbi:hypothetical protein FNF27_02128 [Cafeteria roenbergensis]|uniref:Uncharacterized protein n=1 Tax=Cafeteria roenbergensis TaxID=33653 RepID=A0A5A8EFZ3_CAFRO|nr:hypothetical protein FNF27_02128 [Cafeteria roenbergensis]
MAQDMGSLAQQLYLASSLFKCGAITGGELRLVKHLILCGDASLSEHLLASDEAANLVSAVADIREAAVAEATARFSEAQGLAMDSRAGFEPSEADLDIATAASILGRLRCSPGATLIDASGGGAVFVAAASLLGSFSRVVVWSRPGSALRGELDAFANVQRQEGALPDDGPAVDVVDAACLSDFWAHRRVDCRVAAAEALLLSAGDAPGMGGSCASPGTEAARAGHATSTSANGIVSRLGLGARVVVFGGSLEAEGLWLDAEVPVSCGRRSLRGALRVKPPGLLARPVAAQPAVSLCG